MWLLIPLRMLLSPEGLIVAAALYGLHWAYDRGVAHERARADRAVATANERIAAMTKAANVAVAAAQRERATAAAQAIAALGQLPPTVCELPPALVRQINRLGR